MVLKDYFLCNSVSKLRRWAWSRIEYTHGFRSLEHWCSLFDSRTGHGYARPMLFSVNMVMNTRFPYIVINFLTWWGCIILSKMTASVRLASRHFRWADPPSSEFYKMSLSEAIASEFFLNSNKVKGFVHESWGRKLCRSNTIWQHVERL